MWLWFPYCGHISQMVWRYWFASITVTLAIILFIIPMYYGFWTLGRQTTLSPFETARAFHAPVLDAAPHHLDTKDLLKEVGSTRVHEVVNQAGVVATGELADGKKE